MMMEGHDILDVEMADYVLTWVQVKATGTCYAERGIKRRGEVGAHLVTSA